MNEFQTMAEAAISITRKSQSMLVYCDYIANLIKRSLMPTDQRDQYLIADVSGIKLDMDTQGAMQSTKKVIEVVDRYGKKYLITVEEK